METPWDVRDGKKWFLFWDIGISGNADITLCRATPDLGNEISSFKKEISKNNFEKYVIFHGPKYKDEKYQFILNSDIYIQPSFSEGISFSILDAMACGKPMILTRQTNMTYYYNKNFYEMTEPYPEDIAQSIKKLALNKELSKKLGNNSSKLISTIFNWDSLINEYIKMYKKIKN